MDLATVFDWFAQESMRIAEQAKEPREREMFLRLALMWAAAAHQCHGDTAREDDAQTVHFFNGAGTALVCVGLP